MSDLEAGDDKNDKDYKFPTDKHYGTKPKEVFIYGVCNIISVLNFLLENPRGEKLFYLRSDDHSIDMKTHWRKKLSELYTQSIDDKTITKADYEKITPFIKNYLDEGYNLLCKETLVLAMPKKPEMNYGDDLLKHPLYQTLSLLLDDYDQRKAIYLSKNFLDPTRGSHPSRTAHNVIYAKYLPFIPAIYRSTDSKNRTSGIDSIKIKQSIPLPTQQNVMQIMPAPATSQAPTPSAITLKKQ
jgi:hypothetical protein